MTEEVRAANWRPDGDVQDGLFLWISPQTLLAEWRVGPGSELYDGTVSVFGVTERGVGVLAIMCREGRPLLWTQGWALAKAGPDRQEGFSVIVDGQSFTVTGQLNARAPQRINTPDAINPPSTFNICPLT